MGDKRSKLVLGLFFVSAVVVFALSLYTGFLLSSLTDSLEQSRDEFLLAEAHATSLIVSAEELDAIVDTESLSDKKVAAVKNRLNAYVSLHGLTEISYIRALSSGELQYLISSDSGAGVYDISAAPVPSNEMVEQALSGAIVIAEPSKDPEFLDTSFLAYAPVYDEEGGVVAVAAIGTDDHAALSANSSIRDLTIILLICIAVIILAACASVLLQLRREADLEENLRIQKLMIRISQELSSEQAFEKRVNFTLELLGTNMNAAHVFIMSTLESPEAKTLYEYWHDGISKDTALSEKTRASSLKQAMRRAFANKSVHDHPLIYCPDITQAQEVFLAHYKDTDTKSFIWAPLFVQNELWGVLALDFTQKKPQSVTTDIQLVESAVSDLVGALTRELYNEQRERALDHAVRASEAKSEFLSNMSHEMRTPMNAIIGMASIALSSDDNKRKDYCLEHIEKASKHLLGIINDVLDMSSLQTRELMLENAEFNVRDTLDCVVNDFAHTIREQKLSFALKVDERIPFTLMGDKGRLSQILRHLISNAIKFTPAKGSIALRVVQTAVEPAGHSLLFEIEDNGIGVDPSVRSSLFGSFSQVESGATRQYGGAGLGLAISQRLIELMKGQIGVKSTLNEGSTFYFSVTFERAPSCSLSNQGQAIPSDQDERQSGAAYTSSDKSSAPATEEEPEQRNATLAKDSLFSAPLAPVLQTPDAVDEQGENLDLEVLSLPDLSRYRILLAEDIDINREVVIALLAKSGISIETTTNGLEVLEVIKNDPGGYDLLFMDIQMPKMDGLEAAQNIRALGYPETADLPIIAMTSNVFQEDIDACLAAGMNDHIGKPVSLKELYRVLLRYLPKK